MEAATRHLQLESTGAYSEIVIILFIFHGDCRQ